MFRLGRAVPLRLTGFGKRGRHATARDLAADGRRFPTAKEREHEYFSLYSCITCKIWRFNLSLLDEGGCAKFNAVLPRIA
jgi:hypothetical protein